MKDKKRKQQQPKPESASAPVEDVNPNHQADRITRCRQNLKAAKDAQKAACEKLSKLAPTSPDFDSASDTLLAATKALISARQSFINCARGI